MYTECPNCHTFFKVTPAQLKVADGRVRCGHCSEVFNAISSLMEEIPPSALERRKSSEPAESSSKKSAFDSDIVEMEAAEDSFADIDIPGIDETDELVDDSSLSGLAGSEPVSDVLEMDSASLSDLSDLTDIPSPETAADSVPPSVSQLTSGSAPVSSVSALDDLGLSSVQTDFDEMSQTSANGTREPAPTADLSDINRDIDNALDGLFDEDFTAEAPVSEKVSAPSSKILEDTDLTDIPDLDEPDALPELDLNHESIKSSVSEPDLELDLSDEPYSELASRQESKRATTKSAKSKPSELDDFELDDNLLDSDTLDMDDSDWSPAGKQEETSELYSGDSFILEELDDDKSRKGSGGISKLFWASLIFVLIIVLAGQFIFLKRETLVQYPQVVPILELECKILGMFMPCEVPERRAPELIEMVDRTIVSHPNAENALLITTTIRNTAEFDQPYPKMILTFSDINQKVVARRMFTPEEYLAKDVDIASGMKAGVAIKVILEIVDPGEEAVNFQFDFK